MPTEGYNHQKRSLRASRTFPDRVGASDPTYLTHVPLSNIHQIYDYKFGDRVTCSQVTHILSATVLGRSTWLPCFYGTPFSAWKQVFTSRSSFCGLTILDVKWFRGLASLSASAWQRTSAEDVSPRKLKAQSVLALFP